MIQRSTLVALPKHFDFRSQKTFDFHYCTLKFCLQIIAFKVHGIREKEVSTGEKRENPHSHGAHMSSGYVALCIVAAIIGVILILFLAFQAVGIYTLFSRTTEEWQLDVLLVSLFAVGQAQLFQVPLC